MLNHGTVTAGIINHMHNIPGNLPKNWIVFSYLPLAHVFGRMCEGVALATGCVYSNLLTSIPLASLLTGTT